MDASVSGLLTRMWDAVGTPGSGGAEALEAVEASGPRVVLPSVFDVTGLATCAVAAATLAAAHLHAVRRSEPLRPVTVESTQASAAFRAEALFAPAGWTLPSLWGPLAGNYRTADGWIRLHTNYTHHRAAVCAVLGAEDRDGVRAAVAGCAAEELEGRIVEAGGAAAALRTREEWLSSDAGEATRDAPLFTFEERESAAEALWPKGRAALPFSGVRVLDLTRVIAGPVCTKFLAAYGADVLRLDPPGFDEVASLLPETTVGKRTAAVDLGTAEGRGAFEALVTDADVLVTGYRADALAKLGYDDGALAALSPGLVIARLNAYGWDGPWQNRRGFDSLVQMSCGIASDGAAALCRDEPVPLPAQALDHATGWLLAATVARALTRRFTTGAGTSVRGSLIGTANLLYSLVPPADPLTPTDPPAPEASPTAAAVLEDTRTAWGLGRRVALPGSIDGIRPRWVHEAGPLGHHPPCWEERV